MEKEFSTFCDHLPLTAEACLDIGAGLGGINSFLYRHYGERLNLHLLDRVGMDDKMKFGFREATEKYNDPDLAKSYLAECGVRREAIHFWDADSDLSRLEMSSVEYDVILSLKSWGYHYPYSTYSALAKGKLKRNGRLIVDIRKNTGQEAALEADFRIVAQMSEDRTLDRFVCEHHA